MGGTGRFFVPRNRWLTNFQLKLVARNRENVYAGSIKELQMRIQQEETG